jgi:hypothetical protein
MTVAAYIDGGTITGEDSGLIGTGIDDTQAQGSTVTTWSSAKIWERTQSPKLFNYSEKVIAIGDTGANLSIDLTQANVYTATLNSNTTIAVSGASAGAVWNFSLLLTNDAVAGRTITMPAGTKYEFGVVPPRTTTANATDMWNFTSYDGGVTWIASIAMLDIK